MSDNKNKTGHPDSNLISFKQKYEVDYAVNQLKKKFPDETKQDIKEALFDAAKATRPSEGREKVMRKARQILND